MPPREKRSYAETHASTSSNNHSLSSLEIKKNCLATAYFTRSREALDSEEPSPDVLQLLDACSQEEEEEQPSTVVTQAPVRLPRVQVAAASDDVLTEIFSGATPNFFEQSFISNNLDFLLTGGSSNKSGAIKCQSHITAIADYDQPADDQIIKNARQLAEKLQLQFAATAGTQGSSFFDLNICFDTRKIQITQLGARTKAYIIANDARGAVKIIALHPRDDNELERLELAGHVTLDKKSNKKWASQLPISRGLGFNDYLKNGFLHDPEIALYSYAQLEKTTTRVRLFVANHEFFQQMTGPIEECLQTLFRETRTLILTQELYDLSKKSNGSVHFYVVDVQSQCLRRDEQPQCLNGVSITQCDGINAELIAKEVIHYMENLKHGKTRSCFPKAFPKPSVNIKQEDDDSDKTLETKEPKSKRASVESERSFPLAQPLSPF